MITFGIEVLLMWISLFLWFLVRGLRLDGWKETLKTLAALIFVFFLCWFGLPAAKIHDQPASWERYLYFPSIVIAFLLITREIWLLRRTRRGTKPDRHPASPQSACAMAVAQREDRHLIEIKIFFLVAAFFD
jgi:hypothetical protein